MSSIALTSNYLQSLLVAIDSSASTSGTSNSSTSSLSSATSSSSDNSQLSPFAQLLSTLQNLQQSNPTEYKSVMTEVAANLKNAASTATSDGNSTEASQLTALASDFTSAASSGDLPNIQDLAQALGGSGGGLSGPPPPPPSSSSSSSSDGSSSSTSEKLMAQILAAYQASNGSQSNALNPMSIIMNTLSSAGVTVSDN